MSKKVFINCGARTGQDIINFKNSDLYSSDFELIAFECLPHLIDEIKKIPNVTVINKAISTVEGTLTFYIGSTDYSGTLRSDKSKNMDPEKKTITVESVDFSKWLAYNYSIEDTVIVSMDIEGEEYTLIPKMNKDGSLDIIDKLYIEVHKSSKFEGNEINQKTFEDLNSLLIKKFKTNVYIENKHQHKEFLKINNEQI